MDKKGTDKILSMYWFVILILIAGGIFAMVYIFYGAPYDVREIESNILANKIANCISNQGVINAEFFTTGNNFNSEINKTFTNQCNLIFEVEDGYIENEIQYFYEIKFYAIDNTGTPAFSFYDGNLNWKEDCFIEKDNNKEYSRLAKCTEERLYAVNGENEQYLIKILSAIGKSEKNVKS
jgi:hypothetical protein